MTKAAQEHLNIEVKQSDLMKAIESAISRTPQEGATDGDTYVNLNVLAHRLQLLASVARSGKCFYQKSTLPIYK